MNLPSGPARSWRLSAPRLSAIGRAEGRGAGIVVAPGAVLTSAHNLRGDESTVTFADGRSLVGTVKGVDADGDLAVVGVDTGSINPVSWAESTPAVPGRAGIRPGAPHRRGRGAHYLRHGLGHRTQFPGAPGTVDHRRGGAHRPARPRFVRRARRRHGRTPGGHQYPPARGRLLSGPAGDSRPCTPGSTPWPGAKRPPGAGWAWPSPLRIWPDVCGPRWASRPRRRPRPRRGRRQPGGHRRAVARRPDRHRRRAAGHVDR